MSMLLDLMNKYGTDKQGYASFYENLWGDGRELVKKVLELGIGCPETMRHVPNYQTGASLRVWRDYFPNAQIYGADIKPETIFEEDRIKTYLVDEKSKIQLGTLIDAVGKNIDLVIDDASHNVKKQANACLALMPLLNRGVTYIIEDVVRMNYLLSKLRRYICTIPNTPYLLIVKHR